MKRTNLILGIAAASLVAMTSQQASALKYSQTSQLAQGKWVKIGIPDNGIYELSYDQLKDMGFDDPAKVSLWGEGGVMYPLSFVSEEGERLIPDQMEQVPMWHNDNRVYFYAKGPENIAWSPQSINAGGAYVNNCLNIYTKQGIYFLSDSATPITMSEYGQRGAGASTITTAFAYAYHEVDLTQGGSNSGRTFWGEDFLKAPGNKMTFTLPTPGAVKADGGLAANFMASSTASSRVTYTVDGTSVNSTIAMSTSGVFHQDAYTRMFGLQYAGGAEATIQVGWMGSRPSKELFMDYLLLTYQRSMDFAADEKQFFVSANVRPGMELVVPAGAQVWDVTDPYAPVVQVADANGRVQQNVSDMRSFLFFKTGVEQKHPVVLGAIDNQDIRKEAIALNPDFVILTTSQFKEQAEELAEFHRQNEGLHVYVADVYKLYNEFSAGRPDPMAYRNFLRLLYELPGSRLKAVMSYGRQRSDLRFVGGGTPTEAVIVFQGYESRRAANCQALIDAYGMLGDTYPSEDRLTYAHMDIAVGIAPLEDETEAHRYNAKLSNYYFDTTLPYWLERYSYIADDANDGLHVECAEELADTMCVTNPGMRFISDKVYLGEYGSGIATERWLESAYDGVAGGIYFGHANPSMLGLYTPWLVSSDIPRFRNSRLPFMHFACCETSHFEIGARGVIDNLIFGTEYGFIGGQVSVRSAYASENRDYMNIWHYQMLDGYDKTTGQPLTVGEITRLAKNTYDYSEPLKKGSTGKYKFHLMIDPMMRLATPTLKVDLSQAPVTAVAGSTVKIAGEVKTPAGVLMEDFNGPVVVKWHHKGYSQKPRNLASGYTGNKPPKVDYDQDVASVLTYQAVNGRFSMDVECPAMLSVDAGSSLTMTVTTYDASKRLGGTTSLKVAVEAPQSDLPVTDTDAPVIERISIGEGDQSVVAPSFTVSVHATDATGIRVDEKAFDQPLRLVLDGKEYLDGIAGFVTMADGGKELYINYPVSDLSAGTHNMELQLTDYYGNRVSREMVFTVNPGLDLPPLTLEQTACRTTATFFMPEEVSGVDGTPELIILDILGNEISKSTVTGTTCRWNLTDSKGQRVAPGLYKAYVRYKGSATVGAVTRPVTLPVLSRSL